MQIAKLHPGMVQPHPDRAAIAQLEQAFLEEMLKYCGPKPMAGAFSGGAGEDHFGSFLVQHQAAILASAIDFGLAARLDGGRG